MIRCRYKTCPERTARGLLDQGYKAVPEHLPLCVHAPKHKQQMQRWVLTEPLLVPAPLEEVGLAPSWRGWLLFSFLFHSATGPPGNDAHGVVQPPRGQRGLKLQERPPLLPCSAKRCVRIYKQRIRLRDAC